MAIIQKMMTVFVCERCEHEWVPRDPDVLPMVCSSCKSPYWNRPRRNAVAKPSKKKASRGKRA